MKYSYTLSYQQQTAKRERTACVVEGDEKIFTMKRRAAHTKYEPRKLYGRNRKKESFGKKH